jgi:hypothetical protein
MLPAEAAHIPPGGYVCALRLTSGSDFLFDRHCIMPPNHRTGC